jgi:hypothetical protein
MGKIFSTNLARKSDKVRIVIRSFRDKKTACLPEMESSPVIRNVAERKLTLLDSAAEGFARSSGIGRKLKGDRTSTASDQRPLAHLFQMDGGWPPDVEIQTITEGERPW